MKYVYKIIRVCELTELEYEYCQTDIAVCAIAVKKSLTHSDDNCAVGKVYYRIDKFIGDKKVGELNG